MLSELAEDAAAAQFILRAERGSKLTTGLLRSDKSEDSTLQNYHESVMDTVFADEMQEDFSLSNS